MGATPFMTLSSGKDANTAFRNAVESALYDCGHGGYSGTIAEKDFFVRIELPQGASPQKEANRLIDDCDERIDDKWGPAGMFDLGKNHYLFFGWASS